MRYTPKNPELAGIQGKRLETRYQLQFNKPLAKFLMECKESGMSLNTVAKQLGCKRETLVRTIKRLGMEYPAGSSRDYYALTINKITTTKQEHCRLHGVTYDMVEYYQSLHELSFPEALSIAVARRKSSESQ